MSMKLIRELTAARDMCTPEFVKKWNGDSIFIAWYGATNKVWGDYGAFDRGGKSQHKSSSWLKAQTDKHRSAYCVFQNSIDETIAAMLKIAAAIRKLKKARDLCTPEFVKLHENNSIYRARQLAGLDGLEDWATFYVDGRYEDRSYAWLETQHDRHRASWWIFQNSINALQNKPLGK